MLFFFFEVKKHTKKTFQIFDTTVTVEVTKTNLKKYFKINSVSGLDLKTVGVGVGGDTIQFGHKRNNYFLSKW